MSHRTSPCRIVVPPVALAAFLLAGATGAHAQRGRLNGLVHDTDGRPIKGATIVAERGPAQARVLTVVSDARGRFEIPGLQGGTWRFTVSAPGYIPQQDEEDISLRGKRPIEFRLPRVAQALPGTPAVINARQLQADLQAAEALLRGGRYDEAIAAYQTILSQAPALTAAHLQIGDAYRLKKDYDGAITAYRELLKSEPANDRAIVALATAYSEKGDVKAAEETLAAAAAGPAPTANVYCALGDLRFEQHRMDEAAASYRKATAQAPGWVKPLYKLGLLAVEQGDTPAAIGQLEKVIAADPKSPEAEQARTLVARLKK